MNEQILVKKDNQFNTFEDMQKTASMLSNDISIFLGEEIEELNVSAYNFRVGMERSISRVMNSIVKQKETILIYPDSIPGFTLMVFKKKLSSINVNPINVERNPVKEMNEAKILDGVISRFFSKNQQKVLIIENNDIIFALFPVADTRKNLKDLELYITY